MDIILIILLAIVCAWLLYKIVSIRRGIVALTKALKSEKLPDRDSLGPHTLRGRLDELCTTALDRVTDVEIQKERHREREKILDYVTNQIDDALLIVDSALEITFSNKAAEQLFPSDSHQVGSQLIEICYDHRIADLVSSALEDGQRKSDQIEIAKISKIFSIEAAPFDKSPAERREAWVLIRDITAQIQTEQIRKDFVANASHELRTPLSIINGHLEMLADDVDNHTLRVMQKHTERLGRIVEDMLTISKLENTENHGLLKKENFDLKECVAGIVDQLQPLIDERKAKVKIDLLPGSATFPGDRFYFDQIFFNLIENALKQNPGTGLKVTIRIAPEEEEGQLIVEVIDDGVGIPAADLKDIFKRFYRVEKHHSQVIKGTGLGLSIVKRAVEAHDGTISVTSQPGHETCFRISLPALAEKTEPSPELATQVSK